MKSFSVMFLIAIIMTRPLAQALNCHVCTAMDDDCSKPMRCPELATYCKTIRTYSPTTIYKSCVSVCTKDSMEEIHINQNAKVSCCQSDLCNGAASWTPGSSGLVFAGLLSIFWGLFALGL
ncbi:ly-6/neurotoxin-like protein 1 [Monodelphis domestica]|uniref:Ly-6/neurotoxin-like protein 1 n=1 Tax=Monodelphis domestica TaxID=13616 RepID=K7E664_MONDO|nr:ly-6/neurotoxin-like protein 1 [Monodelphis domestica]